MPVETLTDMLEDKYMNETAQDFIWAFQQVYEEFVQDIDDFTKIVDPDRCPPQFLDAMFYELGFKLWNDLELSTTRKRKLVKSLLNLYSSKGTKTGMENAIYFFLGITVSVYYPFDEDTWTLGYSDLGVETELAPGDVSNDFYYTLNVDLYESIDSEVENLLNKIMRFMAPARFDWNINQPGQTERTYWTLGVSELGLNTVLQE